MTAKAINLSYWISTIIFAALMIFSSVGGIQPSQQAIQMMHDGLGYPVYFIQFISIAKLIGAIVILIPGLNRIKEWAYAGLFFDLAGAVYSGVAASGKFDPMMLTLAIWIVPGIVSYYFWHKKMNEKEPARTKTTYETVG
ncbi:MAG: DoxX family protein [Ferruginibacter sp.]|nr:DoxX family protein [Ferruginibacter sp.]